MAQFVGQNTNTINSEVNSDFFGKLQVVQLQKNFNYLNNVSEDTLIAALNDAIIEVDYDLAKTTKQFNNLAEFVVAHRLKEAQIMHLYQKAVFNKAITHILTIEITSNDTKEAAERVANLNERIEVHNTSARTAIAMLQSDRKIKVEVV